MNISVRLAAPAMIAGMSFVLSQHASAQHRWVLPESGAFDDPDRWFPHSVPGTTTDVIFGKSTNLTPYTVTLDQARTVRSVRVSTNRVTIPLQFPITASSSVVISRSTTPGQAPRLTLDNGLLTTQTFTVGDGGSHAGEFTLRGQNAILQTGTFRVAHLGGYGAARIVEGARVYAGTVSIFGPAATGVLEIGSDSLLRWSPPPESTVFIGGDRIDAAIDIHSGGRFEIAEDVSLRMGEAADADLTVAVRGEGSMFDVPRRIYLGGEGHTDLTVSDGATLRTAGLWIDTDTGGQCTITVAGAGSRIMTSELCYIGLISTQASVRLRVFDGARVIAPPDRVRVYPGGVIEGNGVIEGDVDCDSGRVVPRTQEGGAAVLTVEGNLEVGTDLSFANLIIGVASATENSRVDATSVRLGAHLALVPLDGFQFALGQSFEVMRYQSRSGTLRRIVAPGFRGQATYNANSIVVTLTHCIADSDTDGVVDSADFFAFLTAFFRGEADINADGVTNSTDFFEFLESFFNCG